MTPPATAGETVSGRLVLNFTFAVNHAMGGLDVRGYHVVNILIHTLAALTLFGVVRRTIGAFQGRSPLAGDSEKWHRLPAGVSAAGSRSHAESQSCGTISVHTDFFALSVALLWALHPLHTGAVTYIVQRAESMCGLFYLLTL